MRQQHQGRFALVGGRVIDPASGVDGQRTVWVENGRIVGVESAGALPSDATVVDCTGCWILPGFVDLHAHLREPGDEHKETIATGARAAVAGGFTTVVAMPNTKPVIDSAALVEFVLRKSDAAGLARVVPSAAVTVGQKGELITQMAELADAGAVLFTDDGLPIANAGVMRRALEYSTLVDRLIMVHEEEPTLSGGCMHEGDVSLRMGLKGIPHAAEDVMVHRDVELAALTGGRVHIGHLSTEQSVRAVRDAKLRGLPVTAEATPHHFSLTHDAVDGYATFAKMAPPLRTAADVEAVIEGLADGTIDAIATDHAPHATVDKEVEFEKAANGIIGLETAFGLTMKLVHSGRLSATRAVQLLSSAPAKLVGLPAGSIAVGELADIAVVRPDVEWTVERSTFQSKSDNTPFLGATLRGAVERTFVGGLEVWRRIGG